jgi:putative hydroxymethylpyrimidine transport system substrate-binding protein
VGAPVRRPRLSAALLLAVALLVAGCGGSSGGGSERVDLMLDFFPNADHAGIYNALATGEFKKRGLDVRVRAPSDPAAPLKLVAAGKADLGISYEPDVLLARDKGLKVVAVAALVRVPLTSIISLPEAGIRAPSDLRGKTVGTAGIPYQAAYLKAIEPGARERNIGFDFVPALVSGKVDATLGAFWNYEAVSLRQRGKHPRVIRMEQAGVPTYDELVVVAGEDTVRSRPEVVRKFLAGLGAGTRSLASDPDAGLKALLDANPDLDPALQRESVKLTTPYFLPKNGEPYGYMDPGAWSRFTAFMHDNGLVKVTKPAGAFTNSLLPR